MSDPQRFIEGPKGELEAELLRSVHGDAPGHDARARTLAALGVSAGALGVVASTTAAAAVANTATAKGAVGLAFGSIVKWVAAGAGIAMVTVGVAHEVPSLLRPSRQPPKTAVDEARPRAALPPAHHYGAIEVARERPSSVPHDVARGTAPTHRTVPAYGTESDLGGSVIGAASARAYESPATKPTGTKETLTTQPYPRPMWSATVQPDLPSIDSKLAEEIAALDTIREAVRLHDSSRALRLLDDYMGRFPSGGLRPEAHVLRIQALFRAGQRDRAVGMAREALAADPASPHADRLRVLLSEASAPQSDR